MKIIKIIALVLFVVLLLVLIPIGVLLSIDLNNYKDLLAQQVEKHTGRQLQIQGTVEKSFFPWLGAHVGALQLSNASGFGDTPMMQLQEVQVKIELLPLFKKQIVVDKVVVHGLQLHLARNAQGVSNWDDLITREEPPSAAPPAPTAPTEPAPHAPPAEAPPTAESLTQQIAELRVGGIDIRDAALVWDDRQARVRYELSKLNVQTGKLRLGDAFDTKVGFAFKASEPPLQGELTWSARVDARAEQQQVRLQDMKLEADLRGEALPIPRLALSLAAHVDSDLQQQTASLSNIKLTALGGELSGSVQAQQILGEPAIDSQLQWNVKDAQALVDALQSLLPPQVNAKLLQGASVQLQANVATAAQTAHVKALNVKLGELSLQVALDASGILDQPAYHGSITLAPFNPRPLLQEMLGELPTMADDKALTRAQFSTQFEGSLNRVSLQSLNAALDDTNISGSTTVTQFDKPKVEFALNVDAIDVDRYLPPPSSETTQSPTPVAAPVSNNTAAPSAPAASEEQEIALPVDVLRELNLQGELNIAKLKAMQVDMTQVHVGVHAAGGVLRADPVQVQLFEGSSTSQVTVDVREGTPRYTVAEVLKDVQFGPLVKQLMGDDYVSGLASLQANVNTQGTKVSDLKQQLNGTFGFDFANGVVKYLDLADIIITDYAKYLRKALPKDDPGKTTAYRIFKGTGSVGNGVVSNQDMYLQSARLEVFGKGNVDLVKETIDYTADTQIHNPTNKMKEFGLDKLQGTQIPVHFYGTFSEPEYGVDWEGTLRRAAKKSLRHEQEKLKESLKGSVKEQEQKLKDKADQEAEEERRKLEEKLKAEEQKLKDKADAKKEEELRKLKEKLEKLF